MFGSSIMNISENTDSDPILTWINSEWPVKVQEKDWKSGAKLLRLFVNHIKTNEGIPVIHQQDIRNKAEFLLNNLSEMELDAAAQCVSAIDHANARLDSTHTFGSGFKSTLEPAELKSIKRRYQRIKCRSAGSESVEP